jgi:hypothetical protein
MKINADIIGGGNNYTYDTETGILTDDYEDNAIVKRVLDKDYWNVVGLLIESMNDMYNKNHHHTVEFDQTNKLVRLYLQTELPF